MLNRMPTFKQDIPWGPFHYHPAFNAISLNAIINIIIIVIIIIITITIIIIIINFLIVKTFNISW